VYVQKRQISLPINTPQAGGRCSLALFDPNPGPGGRRRRGNNGAEDFESGKHYFFSAVSTAGCHACPTESSLERRFKYGLNGVTSNGIFS